MWGILFIRSTFITLLWRRASGREEHARLLLHASLDNRLWELTLLLKLRDKNSFLFQIIRIGRAQSVIHDFLKAANSAYEKDNFTFISTITRLQRSAVLLRRLRRKFLKNLEDKKVADKIFLFGIISWHHCLTRAVALPTKLTRRPAVCSASEI